MIIVTPRLVQPVSDISKLRTPLDGLRAPSDIEAFLGGMNEGRPVARLESNTVQGSSRLEQREPREAFDTSQDSLAEAGGLAGQYGHTLN